MSDTQPLPGVPAPKEDNQDPEYQRLLAAYADNPFHDMTKATIEEYVKKTEQKEEAPQPVASI